MGISLIATAARYWWVILIGGLLLALKVQSARLHAAVAAEAALKSEVEVMNQQNHGLKAASDECNERVEQLRQDGQSLQASLDDASRKADAIGAAGVRAAADTMAHLPTGDCESLMRYGHQEAGRFKW